MVQATSPSQLLIRRVALVAIVAVVAIAAAVTIGVLFLDLDNDDVSGLLQLLFSSTVLSLGGGALFVWLAPRRHWNRFSARLLATFAAGLAVFVVNVGIAALAMFRTNYDLGLLALLIGFATAITAIFAVVATDPIEQSLRALTYAAGRATGGDPSILIPSAPEREFTELGASLAVLASRLDISFRRQLEVEAAYLGLIAVMTREIGNPVSSLGVMVESIRQGQANDRETAQRYLTAMERETTRLRHVLDDLQEMAELDAGRVRLRLQPHLLAPLMHEAVELLGEQARRTGIEFRWTVDPGVPPALIDPERVRQTLVKLIQNAIRHTPAGGVVVVSAYDRGPDVQIDVRDSGEGIPAADLPRVFDRFYRGGNAGSPDGPPGAGVGLSIARRLIEMHGGRIWVTQPVEGGSIFSFTLPKVPPPR